MELISREEDKLLLFTIALAAERRLARGLKLNYPESVALISAFIMEGARDGKGVALLMEEGRHALTHGQVMEGVPETAPDIQVETTFPDGSKLVIVHDPIIWGSATIPDEHHVKSGQTALNTGRATCRVVVENHGDRPIQVGSHYHFAEVNPALKFDRQQVTGYRLNVPAGMTVRFKSGQKRKVELVVFAGHCVVFDLHGKVMGPLEANGE